MEELNVNCLMVINTTYAGVSVSNVVITDVVQAGRSHRGYALAATVGVVQFATWSDW